MKNKLTTFLLICSLTFTTMLTSCYGSFKAFNGIRNWNQNVTNNKWANEIIFLVLWIVPVYELFLLGDLIIFNLVEFWSGSNPLAMEEGDIEEQNIVHNGKDYKMRSTKNKLEVFDSNGVLLSALAYNEEESTWYVAEGKKKMKKLITVMNMTDVDTEVKVFNGECEEGMVYAVKNDQLAPGTAAMVW